MLELYRTQKEVIDIANRQTELAIFHEQGLGKTRTMLEVYHQYKQRVPALKMLIICPISVIVDAWQNGIDEFNRDHDTSYQFHNMRKDKGLMSVKDIFACNFEMITSVKGKQKIIELINSMDFICCIDESSKLKNPKAQITKTLLSLEDKFLGKFILSGTPAPNGHHEYWAQMRFINPDIFPSSFYEFRNRYFHLQRNGQVAPVGYNAGLMLQQGYQIAITDDKLTELNNVMAPYIHRADKATSGIKLPPKVFQTRTIQLNADEKTTYKNMEKDLILELKDSTVVAQNVLTKVMKLRQITSGFVYDQQQRAVWFGKSKINELMATLEELGNQQVIIWCQFIPEIEYLNALLDSKCAKLYGGTEDRESEINAFKSGKKQYLLAHPKSAAHGLTFVNCSTMIYFSLDYSLEGHLQSQDRNHRGGQTAEHCLYIYLLAENSVDWVIYNVLQRKEDNFDNFIRRFLR